LRGKDILAEGHATPYHGSLSRAIPCILTRSKRLGNLIGVAEDVLNIRGSAGVDWEAFGTPRDPRGVLFHPLGFLCT